ncbi:MAG: hypothetical protein MI748_06155 [Opitutales bacterium]|nr:hypothetical protein [Opitutales bacterium]
MSGNPDMKGGDLRFREAARYVATALEGKGYRQTQQVGNADLLVELTFYTDEPREVLDVRHYPETYYRPGFAYSIQVPVYNSAGVVIGYRSRIMREPSRSYTHWQEQLESVTVYDKVMEISAYDNRPNAPTKDLEEMWSIVITNSDTSQDIRSYLPYMVAAAIPYIGEDTGSQIVVSITPDDPTATFIRNPGALE